jgi:hypothetical protein
LIGLNIFRGKTSFDASGLGTEKPDDITNNDDEFDVYRKRMMLAYKFRPNPLVSVLYVGDLPYNIAATYIELQETPIT